MQPLTLYYCIAAGLLFGNWVIMPKFMKKTSHWDGFCIGVISVILYFGLVGISKMFGLSL